MFVLFLVCALLFVVTLMLLPLRLPGRALKDRQDDVPPGNDRRDRALEYSRDLAALPSRSSESPKKENERRWTDPPEDPPPASAEDIITSLRERGRVSLERVYFHPSSDRLREDSAPALDAAGEALLREPDLRLRVEGGSNGNINLAHRRARSVVRYFAGRFGIDVSRLESEGRVAPHGTNVDPGLNRRVELIRLD